MRSLRALAALALAATATLAASLTVTPAQAAPGDGQLQVTVLDADGKPQVGSISVLGANGGGGAAGGSGGGVSSATFDLAPGEYGVLALTPWGGFACSGVDGCDYVSVVTGVATPDGTVVVTAGAVTTVVIKTATPAVVAGTGRVGTPLTLRFSETLESLYAVLGGAGGLGTGPDVQWLRNGSPIEGAIDPTYTPVPADANRLLSARLSYSGITAAYMQQLVGAPSAPVTTPARKISRIPTRTFTRMVRSTIAVGQQAVARIDATADSTIVTGRATVSVGDWSVTRPLRNGTMKVRLPELAPGRYEGGRALPRRRVVLGLERQEADPHRHEVRSRECRARTVGDVSTVAGSGLVPNRRSAVPAVVTVNQ